MHDLGLLASRLALGLSIASHGAQKAFGWFGGSGPEGAAEFMESVGFKPGPTFASAASYSEIGSGVLIALGFGGPLGPAALISTMLVAAESTNRKNGFFAAQGGVELNVLYGAGALAFASSGYGALSLDHAFGLDDTTRHPVLTTLALAAAAAASYITLSARDTSPPDGTLATPTIKGAERGNGRTAAPAPSAG